MIDRRALLKASALAPWVSGLAPAAWSATGTTGPFEVVVAEKLDLQDRVRNRKAPTRVYYPAATGRYPVIIFSPGFGGSLSAFANTGRNWASHGYVVIHPTHADSVQFPDPSAPAGDIAIIRQNLVLRDAADAATRAGLVRLLEKPFYLASRLQDISFIQEGLRKGLPNLDDEIVKRCDLERQGMAGHSFGAYTTLVVSGSTLVPPSASPAPGGFASGLAISGQGAGRMGLNEASFGGITRPLMAVTGTRDFGAAGETPPWRLEAFDRAPPAQVRCRGRGIRAHGFRSRRDRPQSRQRRCLAACSGRILERQPERRFSWLGRSGPAGRDFKINRRHLVAQAMTPVTGRP